MDTTKIAFTDIVGAQYAKRALEVAIAGDHSIQFIGPRGSQVSELAQLARKHVRARGIRHCPCGFLKHPAHVCVCDVDAVHKYQARVLHAAQFDITVQVITPRPDEILRWVWNELQDGEPDEVVLRRIEEARGREGSPPRLDRDGAGWILLKTACAQLFLSPAQVRAVLAVAGTVARLANSECIDAAHMAEAIQYLYRAA